MSVNMESEMDFDDKKFYMNYLDGLTDDMPDEFFRLAQVFELNLFEHVRIDGSSDIYAAYIMNDAVVSFFVFIRDYSFWQAVWMSIFHSIASFNNAGFDIIGGGRGLSPYTHDPLMNIVTALLIILGGIGFYAIKEIISKKSFKKRVSFNNSLTFGDFCRSVY